MPISLTVLILILFNIYFSFKGFNDIKFFKKFFFKINDLKKGEYYRLISCENRELPRKRSFD